jgi:hypothetical protein
MGMVLGTLPVYDEEPQTPVLYSYEGGNTDTVFKGGGGKGRGKGSRGAEKGSSDLAYHVTMCHLPS